MEVVLKIMFCLLGGIHLPTISNDLSIAQVRLETVLPTDVITAVHEFIAKARNNRIDTYGNVRFSLIETTTMKWLNKPSSLMVKRIEYWSREDKYFRIDSTVLKTKMLEKSPDAVRTRFILNTEGYVLLGARTETDSFALIDWGTVDEGIILLFNHEWLQRSARSGRLPADLILDELISPESSLPELYKKMVTDGTIQSKESVTAKLEWISRSEEHLKKIEFSPDGTMLQLVWKSKSAPEKLWFSTSSMTCDYATGVVHSYECEFTDSEFGRMTQRDTLEYDSARFGAVPQKYEQQITNANKEEDSYSSLTTWETKEVDFSPIPIGIFSFEAQGITSLEPLSVWSRRIWILLAGALLFGVVYLIKRAKYRAI